MTLLSTVVHESVKLGKAFRQEYNDSGYIIQQKVLRKLLEKAKNTAFGRNFQFDKILRSDNIVNTFRETVPGFDYDSLYSKWWHRTLNGEKNITWPGKVKYFALTSGTAESASKRIPITSAVLKSIVRTSINQLLTISDYPLPKSFYDKSILMLGGSTNLVKVGNHFEGDLSGILAGKLPAWFNRFYKPGKKIASETNWSSRLELITLAAKNWDIGIIAGVPAWIQVLLEKIIKHYNVKHIHEIWPNLKFFVHGGVYFEPYKKGFLSYLGKEIYYQENYLASEGFLAFQNGPDRKGMQMVLNNGTFFEFIPFSGDNFSPDGTLLQNHKSLLLDEVKEGEEYAILISTNAGTWRYLIGDVIKFTSLENYELIITGRTKHFLSLCGEHLSVDNMNKAINTISDEFGINIKEYAVAGIPYENLFAHKWFIGHDKEVDKIALTQLLDEELMKLNGREGGQNKFPRVLKSKQLQEWEKFIHNKKAHN